MKKISVEIVVIAYNAEQNIVRLLYSLIQQKEIDFLIESIVVYSDSSSDHTVQLAKSVHDSRIKIIDSKRRRGFANAVKRAITDSHADYLTLLNDDIIIANDEFIRNIINLFLKNKKIGLVSSNMIPLKGKTFTEKAVISGYNAYKSTATKINNGNNKLTVDGKSLTLSRDLISNIDLNVEESIMVNVDTYLYLECLLTGFLYRFAKDSTLYFKCPSNARDFVKWQTRNYSSQISLVRKYRKLAEKEFKIPKNIFYYNKIKEIIKNPLGSVYVYILGIYCSYKSNQNKGEFNAVWDLIGSTKDLNTLDV